MTATIQTTDIIGAGTAFTFAANGDSLFVLEGVTLASTADVTIQGNSNSLHVDGTIISGDDTSIRLFGYSSGSTISIGETGVVRSGADAQGGAFIDASNVDLVSSGQLHNDGQIVSPRAIGVMMADASNYLTNTGTIIGATGVYMGFDTVGEFGWGAGYDTLVNSGFISGTLQVYTEATNSERHGVYSTGDGTHITNEAGGVIAGVGNLGTGITIGSGTSIGGGNGSVVINHGTITADEYWAIDFFPMRGGDRAELFNTGIVSGERGSFRGNQTGEQVTNSGTMIGQVDMDQGDDTLTNSGLIDGDVFLGIGADTYEGLADGAVTGTVYGMNLNDTMRGSEANDSFDAGSGNDLVDGRGGDDSLRGWTGNDLISGNTGNDTMTGDAGADTLNGGQGNDLIDGGEDADVIRGGQGDDIIIGGLGRDILFGEEGIDRFVFLSVAESPVGGAVRDAIRDFEQGIDYVDLTAIGGGALDFLGSASFSTASGPAFRVVTTAAGSTVVQVDADGDGARDMEILVQFVPNMTADDFLF
ncbi:hypothetical protein [Marinovum algicola]|uniref:calcium-binding protein n=1 Tax=Alphaproteobacteria TaxID=28211 RepID=UPI0032ECD8EF